MFSSFKKAKMKAFNEHWCCFCFILTLAICYEIVYKDLFELPDVNYAVEKMLHGGAYEASESRFEYTDDGYACRVFLTNGRFFDLDMPRVTKCILENEKLCHFHYPNFPRFTEELQKEFRNQSSSNPSQQNDDSTENTLISRTFESLLPDKYVSCVRQLLREGITPFPYKVAKALDPSMYRNIEFDAWNEVRKEQRMANWYNGDSNFKVGAKCNVRLKKSENDLYTCHIQEISVDKGYCVVFIEQLGEKKMVPYESLSPLPPDQFKPWSLPYRLQRHVRVPRHYNYQLKLNASFGNGSHLDLCTPMSSLKSENWDEYEKVSSYGGGGGGHNSRHLIHPWYNNKDGGLYYRLRQYTSLDNFQPAPIEICTMPLAMEYNQVKQPSTNDSQAKTSESNGNETTTSNNPTANAGTTTTDIVVKTENTEDQSNANGNEIPSNALVPVNPEDNLIQPFENLALEPQMAAVNMTGGYVSNGCCYYAPYAAQPAYYPAVEEFYGGGFACDYPMNCPTGSVYYMYTSQPGNYTTYPAQPNLYITAPAPGPAVHPMTTIQAAPNQIQYPTMASPPSHQPNLVAVNTMPTLHSPYLHTTQSSQTSFASGNIQYGNVQVPTASYSTPNTQSMHTANSSNSYHHSPLTRNRFNQNHINNNETPTNGRINMDARKSVKANGIDLPQDINTLRFFYNLGIEYHKMSGQKIKSEAEKYSHEQQQQQMNQGPQQQHNKEKEKLDENANSQDMVKSDANNNPTNYNQNNNNKNSYQASRRFHNRFFNSARERSNNNPRPSNLAPNLNHQGFSNSNNNMNNRNQNHQQQNDYNHNVIHKGNNNNNNNNYHSNNKPMGGNGGGGAGAGAGNGNALSTPNSSRTHLMSASTSAPNTGGANSHSSSSLSSGRGAGNNVANPNNAGGGSISHSNTGNSAVTGTGQVSKNSYQTKANRFQHHSNEKHCGKSVSASRHASGSSYSMHQNGVVATSSYEQIGDGHHSGTNLYSGPPPNTPSTTGVPPPPHFPGHMFIPMGPPPPYSMYTPNGAPNGQAPPTPGGSLNGANSGYLQPPPTPTSNQHFSGAATPYTQMPPPTPSATTLLTANGMTCAAPINNMVNNTLYVPQPVGSDMSENANVNGILNPDGTIQAGQPFYPQMSYPPPGPPPQLASGIPFYYSPNIHANGMIMNNSAQPAAAAQVYWGQPPAAVPQQQPQHPATPAAGPPQSSHSNENFVAQWSSSTTDNNSNQQQSSNAGNNHSAAGGGAGGAAAVGPASGPGTGNTNANKRNNYNNKANVNANANGGNTGK